jgi:drug/metabolite transporter (DMT)-like permease
MLKLAIGSAMIALAPILVKSVSLGPTAVGVYRCGIAFVILLPFLVKSANKLKAVPIKFWGYMAFAGLFFAADLFVWHRSVVYCGAGIATILANTQVFYLSLIGLFWFHDKLSLKFALSIPVAFIGVFLLVRPDQPASVGPDYWYGIAYGMATGVFYSGFILILKHVQTATESSLKIEEKLGLICFFTAFFLLIAALIEGQMRLPTAKEFASMFALALLPQVIGWVYISTGLSQVNVSKAGLVLLIQPVLATILGALIFQEQMGWLQILGATLTLGAITANR